MYGDAGYVKRSTASYRWQTTNAALTASPRLFDSCRIFRFLELHGALDERGDIKIWTWKLRIGLTVTDYQPSAEAERRERRSDATCTLRRAKVLASLLLNFRDANQTGSDDQYFYLFTFFTVYMAANNNDLQTVKAALTPVGGTAPGDDDVVILKWAFERIFPAEKALWKTYCTIFGSRPEVTRAPGKAYVAHVKDLPVIMNAVAPHLMHPNQAAVPAQVQQTAASSPCTLMLSFL